MNLTSFGLSIPVTHGNSAIGRPAMPARVPGNARRQPIGTQPHEKPATGEQRLWIAVILQTFADASWRDPEPTAPIDRRYVDVMDDQGVVRRKYESTRRAMQAIRISAIAWLRGNTRDFYDVCFLAGTTPEKVREAAKRAEALGWPPILEW